MKKVQLYVCELCHTQYTSDREAKSCENGHKAPAEIKESRYQPLKVDASGYPTKIVVLMSDGKKVLYKR